MRQCGKPSEEVSKSEKQKLQTMFILQILHAHVNCEKKVGS